MIVKIQLARLQMNDSFKDLMMPISSVLNLDKNLLSTKLRKNSLFLDVRSRSRLKK